MQLYEKVIAAGAVAAALGALWKFVFRPVGGFLYNFVQAVHEMLPLLRQLTAVFRDNPNAFSVLNEVAAQFKTDSGSSLRDAVDSLTRSAEQNKTDALVLKINAEATKQLSEQDRENLQRLLLLLDRLTIRVDASSATALRVEQAQQIVAVDLAAAQHRADSTSGEAGAAADAAAQTEGNNVSKTPN